MPPIVKLLLQVAVVIIFIVLLFKVHWALGLGVVVLGAGLFAFMNRSALYAQRGNMAYMKGDQGKALELLEKASKLKRVMPQHRIGYGFLLLKAGRPDEAEGIFREVQRSSPPREVMMQARINLSTAYWLQGRREEGLALMEQVLADYKNTLAYGNLGYFKLLNGDLEQALTLNEEAYEFNDSDVTILDNLAQTYYMLGRLEEAAAMYDKVMDKSPKYAESYYFHALTLRKLGRLDEARAQSEQALSRELALVTPLAREDLERLAGELGAEAGSAADQI
ncbi:Tfp pilus assembly protein PilF [Paenibacillus sp. UNCCL117]|uniref:tetratricopeptide repeat protein n=1 Tax=unclassified Paenibacillus TaxID=185978 RepID=UPI000881EFA9|nr:MULTISPECIES: tetratricopeptide repeat protein [unclassified Paenibacillus]SDD32075.1 Tfp pilus assembly protein PilF [Paenibacillus sp. cl123]SFW39936.1 Tfp pilus assembly protein PilF [Paenibacillus sp. UNCCL117]